MKNMEKRVGKIFEAGYKAISVNDDGRRVHVFITYVEAHVSLWAKREGNMMKVLYDHTGARNNLAARFPQYFTEGQHDSYFDNLYITETNLERLVAEILEWF